jgi:hypothetical protein
VYNIEAQWTVGGRAADASQAANFRPIPDLRSCPASRLVGRTCSRKRVWRAGCRGFRARARQPSRNRCKRTLTGISTAPFERVDAHEVMRRYFTEFVLVGGSPVFNVLAHCDYPRRYWPTDRVGAYEDTDFEEEY